MAVTKPCGKRLQVLLPLGATQLHIVSSATVTFLLVAIASHQFDFAVLPARLFHLFDRGMRLQIGFRALLQLAMDSLVVGIPVCQQTLS